MQDLRCLCQLQAMSRHLAQVVQDADHVLLRSVAIPQRWNFVPSVSFWSNVANVVWVVHVKFALVLKHALQKAERVLLVKAPSVFVVDEDVPVFRERVLAAFCYVEVWHVDGLTPPQVIRNLGQEQGNALNGRLFRHARKGCFVRHV